MDLFIHIPAYPDVGDVTPGNGMVQTYHNQSVPGIQTRNQRIQACIWNGDLDHLANRGPLRLNGR